MADGEMVVGVVHLAVALLKRPYWQVLTHSVGDNSGLPARAKPLPLPRVPHPQPQHCPGRVLGTESPGAAQPEGNCPASSAPASLQTPSQHLTQKWLWQ